MRSPTSSSLTALACALFAAPALAQFTFSPTSYPAGATPDASAAGDFDGDGDLDLAVATDAPDKVSLLFNTGNGTYGAPVNVLLGAGTSPHTPVAGDLDGDGDVDLAVSLKNSNAVRLVVNNGGSFVPGASFPVGADPRDLEIGDLDNDLDNDLVVANQAAGSVTVLRNNGGLAFTGTTYLAGLDPRELDLGDVTGDGLFDIAVAVHDAEAIAILRNLGGAAFVNHAMLSTSPRKPSGVTMSRLDANATLDIAAAGSNNGIEYAVVFLNMGAGAFGPQVAYLSGGSNANSICAADMDVDGDQDLATANQDSGNVSMLPNTGAGIFGAAQTVRVGVLPGQILAGDFDGNGAADLLTTNEASGSVTVLMNSALGASPMHAMCSPGENGVNACPCANPPARMGLGCDNSSGTGGAMLTASGAASLAADTLVFQTGGERPTALSIVLQNSTTIPAGVVFGQGRRCAGGVLKRMYSMNASGGSITAPGPGDPPVSVRSAAVGDPLSAGQNRFYSVYYRDPNVLGGCPAANTFNSTQGGRVIWAP